MQTRITDFFKVAPKSQNDQNNQNNHQLTQVQQQQINEYKKSQIKKKEQTKQQINQFQREMEFEESQQTSYQRKLLLKERKEKRQRELGIGCKITKSIYLGSQDAANNEAWLELENISTIINCSAESFIDNHENINLVRLDLYKTSKTIKNHLSRFVYEMNLGLSTGGNVLVCSEKGTNRSAALLIAYFIVSKKMDFVKANMFVQNNSWKIDLSLSFITELNEISRQNNCGFISNNVTPMNCQPFVRQVLDGADYQLLDRKRRFDFQQQQMNNNN